MDFKFKITEDIELKKEILQGLKDNQEKYGKRYCPCVNPSEYNDDYVCPCKDFKENVKPGESCHCGLYIKEKEKTQAPLGKLYDLNKQACAQLKPLDKFLLNGKKTVVIDFMNKTSNSYYMLLNKENADYTVFHLINKEKSNRKEIANILIDECCINRGQVLSIEKTEDNSAIEIWIQTGETDNTVLCYYFFPYDPAIIEV